MRVRTLKPLVSSYGGFPPGVVVDVPDKVARQWCKVGLAMQDKSLDGAKESKVEPRAEAKVVAVPEDVSSSIASLRSRLGRK